MKRPLDAFLAARSLDAHVSYAGSQDLSAQIVAGAPADVFISAGPTYMDQLIERGLIERTQVRPFARNKLTIVFRSDLEPPIAVPFDLHRPGLKLILGAPEVPIGKAAQEFLSKLENQGSSSMAALKRNVRSYEQSDLALVSKVRLGEADAAIVYQSDARGEPQMRVVAIPEDLNVTVTYFAAPLKRARNPEGAAKLVEELAAEGLESLLPKPGG